MRAEAGDPSDRLLWCARYDAWPSCARPRRRGGEQGDSTSHGCVPSGGTPVDDGLALSLQLRSPRTPSEMTLLLIALRGSGSNRCPGRRSSPCMARRSHCYRRGNGHVHPPHKSCEGGLDLGAEVSCARPRSSVDRAGLPRQPTARPRRFNGLRRDRSARAETQTGHSLHATYQPRGYHTRTLPEARRRRGGCGAYQGADAVRAFLRGYIRVSRWERGEDRPDGKGKSTSSVEFTNPQCISGLRWVLLGGCASVRSAPARALSGRCTVGRRDEYASKLPIHFISIASPRVSSSAARCRLVRRVRCTRRPVQPKRRAAKPHDRCCIRTTPSATPRPY